jgi:hypothetical protein
LWLRAASNETGVQVKELLLVVVGGVLAAAGAMVQQWWSTFRDRKDHAYYLAVRVVVALDRYIDGCTTVALDDGEEPGPYPPEEIKPRTSEPDLSLPDDVDWRSIPLKLAYEIISLPGYVERAKAAIDAVFEGGGGNEFQYMEERQRRCMEIALRAADLTNTLRDTYRIPQRVNVGWDPVFHLRKMKDKFAELDRKRSSGAES